MKKQAIIRGLVGFPIGIAIGYLITILVSFKVFRLTGIASYLPCVPALVDLMGNELKAVVLQAFLSGLSGFAFAGASVIWEVEEWSIAKQTGVYFLITASVNMVIAYILKWMDHSFYGFATYLAAFALIFLVIWLVQYLIMRKIVNQINTKLK